MWIFIAIIFLIFIMFFYFNIKNRILRRKELKIFNNIFSNNQYKKPKIEFGYFYVWPTLT